MRVAIIGGGIIGASVAWHLARRGVRSTVIDAGGVAGQATGRGFGWINASFYLDEAHFEMRQAGIAAWHRVEDVLKSGAVTWPGAINWEWQGDALNTTYARFRSLGYPVEILEKDDLAGRLSGVSGLPERALFFPSEGAVDGATMTRAMLRAAQARVITGVAVEEIEVAAGGVNGVRLSAGRCPADAVVVAAGVGSAALLRPLGVRLPMLDRPGLMLRTKPVERVLHHILAGPTQEVRQDASGRIWAPTAANHQCDETETVVERPDALADQALARLRRMLPGVTLDWEEVALAHRPVPGDGLPVMGPVMGPKMGSAAVEGLHLAVMHSGATLGAIAGEMVAGAVMGDSPAMMQRYTVARFAEG